MKRRVLEANPFEQAGTIKLQLDLECGHSVDVPAEGAEGLVWALANAGATFDCPLCDERTDHG